MEEKRIEMAQRGLSPRSGPPAHAGAMGGDVAVASSASGAEFTLRLPLPDRANGHDLLHAFTDA